VCKLCRTPFCYSNHRHTLQLSNASNYTCPRPEYPSGVASDRRRGNKFCMQGVIATLKDENLLTDGLAATSRDLNEHHSWAGRGKRELLAVSLPHSRIVQLFNEQSQEKKSFFLSIARNRKRLCSPLLRVLSSAFCVIDSKRPRIRLRSRCFVSFAKQWAA
jgi:hypothetical protein